MKRVLTVVAVLLMAALLCCPTCFAADAPAFHHLDELDVDIALPAWENYYFLYIDMPADNPDLEFLEMTPEQVNRSLTDKGILLDVLSCDYSHIISVYAEENDMYAEIYNYRELSTLEREIVLSVNGTLYTDPGVSLTSMEWMDTDNALWLVTEYVIPDSCLCRQYSTVYNGRMLYLDATLYITDEDYMAMRDAFCAVADAMVTGTVFCTTEATPEGVGGITGNLIGSVLDEAGMSTIDLTDAGLGVIDLDQVDLSGLDLEGVVDALGLTEEDAIMLVKGEMAISDVDLSKADPIALAGAIGISGDDAVDLALSALGFGDLDWRGILAGVGLGAMIGGGAALAVIILIIVLLAVCGSKKRKAAAAEYANGNRTPKEES